MWEKNGPCEYYTVTIIIIYWSKSSNPTLWKYSTSAAFKMLLKYKYS